MALTIELDLEGRDQNKPARQISRSKFI